MKTSGNEPHNLEESRCLSTTHLTYPSRTISLEAETPLSGDELRTSHLSGIDSLPKTFSDRGDL